MITFFCPIEQVKGPFKLVITRNDGTIDKLDFPSIEEAERFATKPPQFKAATLWATVEGSGFGLVGINI